jgi:hypothetical protein
MWSDILSDPDFRSYFIGKKSGSGYYQLFKNGTIINETPHVKDKKKLIKKGTFYMKFGQLGHYVAYEMKKNTIFIFDSSHPTGIQRGLYSDCLPDFLNTIAVHFSPDIRFIEEFGTPQTEPGDSFCQTWSLSYLLLEHPHIRHIMDNIGITDEIEILYNLCKVIINMSVFEEICTDQGSWINHNFKVNKAPKKWNSDSFLHFSRNVMDLDSFRYLFI